MVVLRRGARGGRNREGRKNNIYISISEQKLDRDGINEKEREREREKFVRVFHLGAISGQFNEQQHHHHHHHWIESRFDESLIRERERSCWLSWIETLTMVASLMVMMMMISVWLRWMMLFWRRRRRRGRRLLNRGDFWLMDRTQNCCLGHNQRSSFIIDREMRVQQWSDLRKERGRERERGAPTESIPQRSVWIFHISALRTYTKLIHVILGERRTRLYWKQRLRSTVIDLSLSFSFSITSRKETGPHITRPDWNPRRFRNN